MTTLDQEQPSFSEAERNAMRSYLQRCEVRLSTLHRIATAFISGAGLLLLVPVFFKDAIKDIITILLEQHVNQFPSLDPRIALVLTGLLFLSVLYPLLLSLAIPVYGVYLLLKDIVHFYFTIYTPGFSQNLHNPTFALTGVLFSVDESPQVKQEAMRYQYEATQAGFMIPFSKERSELYFDTIIKNTEGDIIPHSRDLERLQAMQVLPEGYDAMNVQRFNAALGIARSLDRTLVQEVAVTEMSLVRHVLYLRRLMLRYVKTLLMFIWTMLIAFMILPFLHDSRFPALLILAAAYFVWSTTVMKVMSLPTYWIYRHLHTHEDGHHIDPQLKHMQNRVRVFCKAAIASSGVAILLAAFGLIVGQV
jgi:hypothetical protein